MENKELAKATISYQRKIDLYKKSKGFLLAKLSKRKKQQQRDYRTIRYLLERNEELRQAIKSLSEVL